MLCWDLTRVLNFDTVSSYLVLTKSYNYNTHPSLLLKDENVVFLLQSIIWHCRKIFIIHQKVLQLDTNGAIEGEKNTTHTSNSSGNFIFLKW